MWWKSCDRCTTCCAWALSLKGRLHSHNVLLVFAYKMSRVLRHIMIKLNKWFTPSPYRTLLQKPCFISQEFNPTVIIILVIFVAKCDMWNGGWHKCSVNLWDILASQNSYNMDITTVKPRFTVPRFTGSLDLPGLNSNPRKQALYVNQCKVYPDIPCFSIYRA